MAIPDNMLIANNVAHKELVLDMIKKLKAKQRPPKGTMSLAENLSKIFPANGDHSAIPSNNAI